MRQAGLPLLEPGDFCSLGNKLYALVKPYRRVVCDCSRKTAVWLAEALSAVGAAVYNVIAHPG